MSKVAWVRNIAGTPIPIFIDEGEKMEKQEVDMVNHPPHYTAHPSGVECIQITEHMNFCVGNAMKYLWRAGSKGEDPFQDLKKARWYIDREITRLEKLEGKKDDFSSTNS